MRNNLKNSNSICKYLLIKNPRYYICNNIDKFIEFRIKTI